MRHLDTERLQGYAEGTIAEGDRAVLESHLQTCPQCTAEVEEWRSLYSALASLPQFAPSVQFAERVMARVQVGSAVPVWAPLVTRAQQLAQRLAPKTTTGWALATAMLALPLLFGGGLVTWLVSKDYITAESLMAFVTNRASDGMQSLGASAIRALMETQLATWLVSQGSALIATAGMKGLGVLGATLCAGTMASIYILYKNLFRTPARESNHASYSFI